MRVKMLAIGIVAALLIGFGIWSNRSVDGKETETKRRQKIGFIDIRKVFEDFEKSKQAEVEIEKYVAEASKKIQNLKEDIREAENELMLLKRNTDMWLAHKEKIIVLRNALRTREKLLDVKTKQKLLRATEEIYGNIVDSLAEYAKKKGIDYVLKTDSGTISVESSVELSMKVNSRAVLYRREGLDITKGFLEYLNGLK